MIDGGSDREALTSAEILSLVEAGIRAPSADNRHIVRFRTGLASLRLRVALDALQGAPLHRITFHEIAFGAVIENVVLRAGELGRTARAVVNAGWRRDGNVAEIELGGPDGVSFDPLARAIAARTTNRRLYGRQAATQVVLDGLAQAASAGDDVRVHWLDASTVRRRALKVIWLAESERFRRERLHAELFEAIRFDVGWNAGADEGLPPGALQVERPFRKVFEALRRWPVQRRLNGIGAATLLGLRAGWLPGWTAPHIALLSVPRAAKQSFIVAGRAFQRFWLAATGQGLALQPMAASIALVNQDPLDAWASAQVCAEVAREVDRLAEGRLPAMLCRLGYAAEPALRSGRLGAASYLDESA